jgi:hypothetical protein
MSAELIPSTQNGLAFSSARKGKILAQFPGSNLRALESGPCPGLSFSLVSGWGRHRFLQFPLSWVRLKTNPGRLGHVSHPATTFFPVDFGNRVRTPSRVETNSFVTRVAAENMVVDYAA